MTGINNAFERNIAKLLGELPSRSRSVIKRRYGLGLTEAQTLEAIGQKEGITRERVRQIENDALAKLKKSSLFASFRPYEEYAAGVLERNGGVVAEQQFLALPEFAAVKDKKHLLFFFDLTDSLNRRKADNHFEARWYTKDSWRPEMATRHAGDIRQLVRQVAANGGQVIRLSVFWGGET